MAREKRQFPDYPSDGKIGIDLSTTYLDPAKANGAGLTGTYLPHTPGERVSTSNNGQYVFALAISTISCFNAVIFGPYGDSANNVYIGGTLGVMPRYGAVPITTTNAAAQGYNMVGIAQTSIDSARYGWIGLNGMLQCNLAVGTNPKLPLYTTSTAGTLGNTTVSAGFVVGIVANTSATSASSPMCFVNWPHLMTSNPV
jgi:hypothetical protein